MDTNTKNEQPVKPALTPAEMELAIADFLARSIIPLANAANGYATVSVTATAYPGARAKIERVSYSAQAGHICGDSIADAVARGVALLANPNIAEKLRREAAEKLAQADAIEARAKEVTL